MGRIVRNDKARFVMYLAGIAVVALLNLAAGWTPDQIERVADKWVQLMQAALLLLAAANVPAGDEAE